MYSTRGLKLVVAIWTLFEWFALSRAAGRRFPVRGIYETFDAINTPPSYDTARIKVLYPASPEFDLFTPTNANVTALPVVIFLGGGIVESNRYQWLGERLVKELGVVFVSYDVFASLNGMTVILPGAGFGANGESVSQSMALIWRKMHDMNENGILAGLLDLNHIVWGGHSAGGRIVLENAKSESFPGSVGTFVYGSHSAIDVSLGAPPATILRLNNSIPILLMGGTLDGVILNFSFRYGTQWSSGAEPVFRTFSEGLTSGVGGYYVEFDGFNHFAIVDPVDTTVGSAFLDIESSFDKAFEKESLASTILSFVKATAFEDPDAKAEMENHSFKKTGYAKTHSTLQKTSRS